MASLGAAWSHKPSSWPHIPFLSAYQQSHPCAGSKVKENSQQVKDDAFWGADRVGKGL